MAEGDFCCTEPAQRLEMPLRPGLQRRVVRVEEPIELTAVPPATDVDAQSHGRGNRLDAPPFQPAQETALTARDHPLTDASFPCQIPLTPASSMT